MLPPYVCVACGYETRHKPSMRRHLYSRKPCPKVMNDIVLADEIKEYILENRVYHIKKQYQPQKVVNQTINNIHTVNNFVAGLDTLDKLCNYTRYLNTPIMNMPLTIKDKLHESIKCLECDEHERTQSSICLEKEDLMNIIRDVSRSVKELQDFNIIYDTKYDEILIFEDDEWQHYSVQTGLEMMFYHIQECLLNAYEVFLIRKMDSTITKHQDRARCRELLTEYYKFLAAFNIDPYVRGKNDFVLKYPSNDEKHHIYVSPNDPSRYQIEERCMKVYRTCREEMKDVERNAFKKSILGILKLNTLKNIKELDKKVSALFTMDEDFKKILLNEDEAKCQQPT
jgi:hypothetical protein